MVAGLETFKTFFADFRDCYVLIGGSACDVYFAGQDIPFRVTHDLDMILCVEALTPSFFSRFWQFVREGGYQHRQKSDGHRQFYRFTAPTVKGYPAMLELFSRKADFLPEEFSGHLTPIPSDEESSSLSGILLDRDYYDFVMANRQEVDGVMILNPIALIVLKAVAWLDLTLKKEADDRHAYSKDISKHKNDIARIVTTIPIRDYRLSNVIKNKMREFMAKYSQVEVDVSALGVPIPADEVRNRLRECFGLQELAEH